MARVVRDKIREPVTGRMDSSGSDPFDQTRFV